MRTRFYSMLAGLITRYPGKIILLFGLITVAMLGLASKLEMRTQFADMMPQDEPKIQEYRDIIENYASASTIVILLESDSGDVDALKKAARGLETRISSFLHIEPSKDQQLSFGDRISLFQGDSPEGLRYDTLELVRRLDLTLDTSFIKSHGLMIQKEKDLKNTLAMFSELELAGLLRGINDNFEKEYVDDGDNLASLDGEAAAIQGLEGIARFVEAVGLQMSGDVDSVRIHMAAKMAAKRLLSGQDYIISPDNSMLLVMLQPAVSLNDYDLLIELVQQLDDSLDVLRKENQEVQYGLAGMGVLVRDEMEAMEKDFSLPSLFALLLILVVLVSAFGSWKNPIFSVITLVVALIWTSGFLVLCYDYMDMMSASFGIILIGLGIDFGIHFISGFQEGQLEHGTEKEKLQQVLQTMYRKVGNGVFTGAMTTAMVFLSLVITRFETLVRMGVIVAIGIVTAWFLMLVLLPAFMVWANKEGKLSHKKNGFLSWFRRCMEFRFLESTGVLSVKALPRFLIILLSIVTVGFSIKGGLGIQFEYDMLELEPEGIPAVVNQEKMIEHFELSPEYALFLTNDLDSCRSKVKELKKIGNRTGLITQVDAITEFMPAVEEQQQKNLPLLRKFRAALAGKDHSEKIDGTGLTKIRAELERLHANIVEIGILSVTSSGEDNKVQKKCNLIVGKKDEDSKILQLLAVLKYDSASLAILGQFQKANAEFLRTGLLRMSDTTVLNLNALPADLKNRYLAPKGSKMEGAYLVSVYPNGNAWDESILRRFTESTEKVEPRITGGPIISLLFIDLIAEKGKGALFAGFVVIFLLLLLDFRSLKFSLLALIPLVVGSVWMVGLMAIFSMKFNYSNFMALPLILGIGIDDGVHMLHRYRTEGMFSMPRVLRFTGRAVLLTSITTGIGFGSMAFASHQGIASMGAVLFLGVTACFLSSVILLPVVISLFEGKKK